MAARKTAAQKKAEAESSTDLSTIDVEALLPDLVQTERNDFDIDARDIQPPRIKAASPTTGAFTDGLVPLFSLFSTKGQDDDAPQVLVEPPTGDHPDLDANPAHGVKAYVLRMYKNKSATVNPLDWQEKLSQDQGGEFRTWGFFDPSAPPFARTQYNYVLYVPESDDADMPHSLLLANTSTPTARFVNTLLAKRLNEGKPIFTTAFRLYTEKRERTDGGQKQRWAVIKAREVAPTKDEVLEAQRLLGMISTRAEIVEDNSLNNATGSATAPAI
jgi:hypothetical protein